MFEISFQKNIKDYKGKAMLGFTWRQIICLALGLGLSVSLYIGLKDYIPESILSYIVLFIAGGLFAVGFIQMNGMYLEKYLFYMIETTFILPRKRYFRSINVEEAIIEEKYEKVLTRINEIDKQLKKK